MNFIRSLLGLPERGRGPNDWMCTASGRQYYPANPRPEDVQIMDIAHHLSMICRFTGAVREFYSVAEHSVLVSQVVPSYLAFYGLMHDAPEAYITDLNRPTKRQCRDYCRLEWLNWIAICHAIGVDPFLSKGDWQVIHDADNAVLLAERNALMPSMPPHLMRDWPQGHAAKVSIAPLGQRQAKQLFIDRYNYLYKPPARVEYPDSRDDHVVFV